MNIQKQRVGFGEGIVILLYFALKPLYLTSSGSLQLSDIVLLCSIAMFVLQSRGKIVMQQKSTEITSIFVFILLYQICVNLVWSIIVDDNSINRHSLYYVFNFLAFTVCLYIGERIGIDRIKKAVALGAFFSAIITVIGLIFFTGIGTRSTGFFNNPNQLGYYSVIMLTIIALCKDQLTKIQIVIIFIVSFWSMIASLSKAAIIAYFGELLVLILFNQKKKSLKRVIVQLLLIAALGTAIYLLFFSDSSLVLENETLLQMRYRILYMSEENDSNLAYGRGYARVLEMIPHIIWGTGEGAYERFVARHGTEVHSTFISLLTCYGLIGLMSYLYLFANCMGKGKRFFNSCVIITGLFLYSITHNGIRNTLLWLILAVMFLDNNPVKKQIEKTGS